MKHEVNEDDIKRETDLESVEQFLSVDVSVIEASNETSSHKPSDVINLEPSENCHLPAKEETFPCLECDQTFSLAKLLQKHQRY